MSLSLRPDFNADLVEKTSQWKREREREEGKENSQGEKQLAAQP